MYHGFCSRGEKDLKRTPIDEFRKQLSYIKKYFFPLKVSDLIIARKSNGSYPENAVAVTIDDGYEDFYHIALPLLKEMGVPATIFVVADLVEENGWMWPDKFHYIVECLRSSCNEFNLKVSKELLSNLKKLPVNNRDDQLKNIAQKYNINIPSEPPPKYKLMSWDQLNHLSKTELIEIGSHTCTHPIMSHLNYEDSWYEINQSKCLISERLNIDVSSFCYPNGQIGDYRDDQKEMLKQAGYICGIASHFGYVINNSDKYSLPRIAGVKRDFNVFTKYLDGIEYFQREIFSKDL
jgi:peptidoglycan/xylan/chitin deacetylase (PgdA/CDA1 family)